MEVDARTWIAISDLIDWDFETFLDELSERTTGTVLLQNIAYSVVGLSDTEQLQFRVKGFIDTHDLVDEEIEEIRETLATST